MSFLHRHPSVRWLAPVLAALLLTAGVSGLGVLSATAGEKLAPRTAAQLLVDVQQAQVRGLSGTIVQNADLGLPSMSGVGSTGSSDLTSLVSGSHTLRLWYAGPNRIRLSLLGSLGESDLVRNGTDLWTWSSTDKSATHRTVSAAKQDTAPSIASGSPVTPQQAATQALKAIDPSTEVSTTGTSTVAGRSVYELLLQPRDASSLIGSVRIAIDGKTHVPMRVQVFAKNATSPAFQVAFTHFDPTTPSGSVFRFNPPPGTTVTQEKADPTTRLGATGSAKRPSAPTSHASKPTVVGSGWTSVLVTTSPIASSSSSTKAGKAGASLGSLTRVLQALPKVSGSWGSGHLLQGTLFSAVLTDDGRLAVGAVAPSALYAALASR